MGHDVSTSSVCQRLKFLEDDFGVKLYKKNKGGIELTGAGQSLLRTASEVLNQLQTLKKTLNHNSETTVQSLTIGGNRNPSTKYLPSAIAAFQKTHPDVKGTLLTSDRASIEKLLRGSEVDIALIQSPSKSSDFNLEPFAVDHLTLFAHSTHPLAKKKRLALDDLAQASVIVMEGRGLTEKVLKQLEGFGLTLNVVLRCTYPDAVKAAVRRKMGLGILFYNLVEEDIKRKEFRSLKFSALPRLEENSYIVHSKNRPLSSIAHDFLSLLRSMKPDEGSRKHF
jgi:DNA-binding transcriptional LysR family regulator